MTGKELIKKKKQTKKITPYNLPNKNLCVICSSLEEPPTSCNHLPDVLSRTISNLMIRVLTPQPGDPFQYENEYQSALINCSKCGKIHLSLLSEDLQVCTVLAGIFNGYVPQTRTEVVERTKKIVDSLNESFLPYILNAQICYLKENISKMTNDDFYEEEEEEEFYF